MHFLLFLGLLLLMSWAFPTGVRYLLVAPLLGFISGGFAWAVGAMIFPVLITLGAFAGFIIVGVILAEVMALVTR